jgi:hypothetical protein
VEDVHADGPRHWQHSIQGSGRERLASPHLKPRRVHDRVTTCIKFVDTQHSRIRTELAAGLTMDGYG